MSTRKQITITRNYQGALDDCTRALELLFKATVRTEDSRTRAVLDDPRGESKNGSRADAESIPR